MNIIITYTNIELDLLPVDFNSQDNRSYVDMFHGIEKNKFISVNKEKYNCDEKMHPAIYKVLKKHYDNAKRIYSSVMIFGEVCLNIYNELKSDPDTLCYEKKIIDNQPKKYECFVIKHPTISQEIYIFDNDTLIKSSNIAPGDRIQAIHNHPANKFVLLTENTGSDKINHILVWCVYKSYLKNKSDKNIIAILFEKIYMYMQDNVDTSFLMIGDFNNTLYMNNDTLMTYTISLMNRLSNRFISHGVHGNDAFISCLDATNFRKVIMTFPNKNEDLLTSSHTPLTLEFVKTISHIPMSKANIPKVFKLTKNTMSKGCMVKQFIPTMLKYARITELNKTNYQTYCTNEPLDDVDFNTVDILRDGDLTIYDSIWNDDQLDRIYRLLEILTSKLLSDQTNTDEGRVRASQTDNITYFLAQHGNQSAETVLDYLKNNGHGELHNNIDQLIRSLLVCNGEPPDNEYYNILKKKYINVAILKYDDYAGLGCHVDHAKKSEAVIITTSIGPKQIYYDMVPVTTWTSEYYGCRIPIKNGQHVIMDGDARYKYYHCLPNGCVKAPIVKYTIVVSIGLYNKIYNGDKFDTFYNYNLLNISNINACIQNKATPEVVAKPYILEQADLKDNQEIKHYQETKAYTPTKMNFSCTYEQKGGYAYEVYDHFDTSKLTVENPLRIMDVSNKTLFYTILAEDNKNIAPVNDTTSHQTHYNFGNGTQTSVYKITRHGTGRKYILRLTPIKKHKMYNIDELIRIYKYDLTLGITNYLIDIKYYGEITVPAYNGNILKYEYLIVPVYNTFSSHNLHNMSDIQKYDFLRKLAVLLGKLQERNFIHRDLVLANIGYDDLNNLILIDYDRDTFYSPTKNEIRFRKLNHVFQYTSRNCRNVMNSNYYAFITILFKFFYPQNVHDNMINFTMLQCFFDDIREQKCTKNTEDGRILISEREQKEYLAKLLKDNYNISTILTQCINNNINYNMIHFKEIAEMLFHRSYELRFPKSKPIVPSASIVSNTSLALHGGDYHMYKLKKKSYMQLNELYKSKF